MSASILILSMALFFSMSPSSPVRHFAPVPISRFPRAVFLREFCEGMSVELKECWASFREKGRVWAADVDGDHVDELIVEPGGGDWVGSLGFWYFLYRRQGDDWISMEKEVKDAKNKDDEVGWQTKSPRFDVLPIVRNGHHDLRVEVDRCLKWDGAKYVWYEPEDYQRLSPVWFNASDNREAEIFWAIRYAGQDTMKFEPQWFPLAKDDFLGLGAPLLRRPVLDSRIVSETLDDPQGHVRWIGILKGGVWCIRGDRVFLLAPQLSETFEGIAGLKFDGDWLLASGAAISDTDEPEIGPEEDRARPSIRYNRRTHELQIERHDYNRESPTPPPS